MPQRRSPARGERGASAVEYALLASLIAVVIIAAVVIFGGAVRSLFETADDALSQPAGNAATSR